MELRNREYKEDIETLLSSLDKRIEAIVTYTMEDFNNSGHFIKEPIETSIKWLTDDLMSIDNVDDLSTIEISLLTLKRLNSLELVNVEMIMKIINEDLINSNNEMIHIVMPKVL